MQTCLKRFALEPRRVNCLCVLRAARDVSLTEVGEDGLKYDPRGAKKTRRVRSRSVSFIANVEREKGFFEEKRYEGNE